MKYKLSLKAKSSTIKSIFLLLAIFSITKGFSQSTSLGIRAGVNMSNWNLSGVTGVDARSTYGPNAGVFATFNLSKSFSLEPGVMYAVLGSELKYSEVEKVEYKTSYLHVPFVARYVFANGFGFFSGPQIAFLLNAKASENNGPKQNAKGVFNKTDFAIVGGMEYNFPVGINVRVKYSQGITDIYTHESQKVKNYSLNLSLAYKFHHAERRKK